MSATPSRNFLAIASHGDTGASSSNIAVGHDSSVLASAGKVKPSGEARRVPKADQLSPEDDRPLNTPWVNGDNNRSEVSIKAEQRLEDADGIAPQQAISAGEYEVKHRIKLNLSDADTSQQENRLEEYSRVELRDPMEIHVDVAASALSNAPESLRSHDQSGEETDRTDDDGLLSEPEDVSDR